MFLVLFKDYHYVSDVNQENKGGISSRFSSVASGIDSLLQAVENRECDLEVLCRSL